MRIFGIEIGSNLHDVCVFEREQLTEQLRERKKETVTAQQFAIDYRVERDEVQHKADVEIQKLTREYVDSFGGEALAFRSSLDRAREAFTAAQAGHEQTVRILTDRLTTTEEQNQSLQEELRDLRESTAETVKSLMDRILLMSAPNPATAHALTQLASPTAARPAIARDRQRPVTFRGQPGQRQRPGDKGEREPILTPETAAKAAEDARAPQQEIDNAAAAAATVAEVAADSQEAEALTRALENASNVDAQKAKLADIAKRTAANE